MSEWNRGTVSGPGVVPVRCPRPGPEFPGLMGRRPPFTPEKVSSGLDFALDSQQTVHLCTAIRWCWREKRLAPVKTPTQAETSLTNLFNMCQG